MLCDNAGLPWSLLYSTPSSRPARFATEYWRHHITGPWWSIVFFNYRREEAICIFVLHLTENYWTHRIFIRKQDFQLSVQTSGMMQSLVFAMPTWRNFSDLRQDLRSYRLTSQIQSKTTEAWVIQKRCNSRLPGTWPPVKGGGIKSLVRIIVHGFGDK